MCLSFKGLFGQSNKEFIIGLSGSWGFEMDPGDHGVTEKWFNKKLVDQISLPGSMTSNGKGDDINVNTPFTGSINDSSWFYKQEYEKYRQPGNIKVPFWLQPIKYYKGPAWYQKTIVIPSSWKGRSIELFIERSHWETSVWADEQLIGTRNSLGTPQIFNLSHLTAGRHRLTIRIDNRVKDINVGINSHSISDHTQTNWNGMVGNIQLSARSPVYIDYVELYPDINLRKVVAKVWMKNISGKPTRAILDFSVISDSQLAERLQPIKKEIIIATDTGFFETSFSMGNKPLLWDEFHANLYSMRIKLINNGTQDEKNIRFGMKEFKANGTQFTINGRKIFLRGALDCAIFPLTGYPPTDVSSWMKIFAKIKSYGLNHIRFHSWCPPEAAFDAADRAGIYFQVECGSWANQGATIGDGMPLDQYIYDESNRIVKTYGNHPSFCMMTYGNEPAGKNHVAYLTGFVNYWKEKDNRRAYTAGAGWPAIPENDYNNIPAPRLQQWEEGLNSIINKERPKTDFDWRNRISGFSIPSVSHEIGQWCVYPDFKEIKKYSGVLKAKNFEIFQDRLRQNGLGSFADSFLLASGKLQSLCYKLEIEAALRTPDFGGFQLLGLQDFPGQGTALVGVLSPFWTDKGYITGKEYSRFCNAVVLLARFPKMIYSNDETLVVPVEVSNFGAAPIRNSIAKWEIKNGAGKILYSGRFHAATLPIGNGLRIGEINQALHDIKVASKLSLSVTIDNYSNAWDLFVYPASLPQTADDIWVTDQFNSEAITRLNNGGKVLLTLKKGSIKKENGGSIAVGFSSIFWNTSWTNGQAPHTLGLLVSPKHPALKDFP
ncbi:MAG: beta-galactosidase, partial [Bacteroidetes bacterium]|nr:beta-galactosidase [Bacteroidota bacterium]